ncbi:MAG TPA: methyltransferase domain-containing protein [Candidatus Dormibacteraeota bacterium]|nr:methyltransferase domain-containing protein [Candidatus Dormibacteraeota bacterium]
MATERAAAAPEGVGLMDAGYFERMHALEETHWWHATRRALIVDLVGRAYPDRSDLRLLDVGAGTGRVLEELRRMGTATGLDLDDDALRFCRRRGLDAAIKANLLALPFAGETFDVAIALDVLEHIEDHVGALREVRRSLRPGGRLFIFVPAYPWLWSLQDEVSHHVRRYTARTLRTAVRDAGFEIEKLSHFNVFLLPVIVLGRLWLRVQRRYQEIADENALHPGWSNGPLRRVFGLELPIVRRVNLPAGASLLCVARKPAATG